MSNKNEVDYFTDAHCHRIDNPSIFSGLSSPAMASITSHLYCTSPHKLLLQKAPSTQRASFLAQPRRRRPSTKILAKEIDLLGDFGARDPFPAEIESQFGEKVLGNVNTEHKILIPNATALSLAQLECISTPQLMSEDEAKKLLFKVLGWRLITIEGTMRLQCLWKLKDSECAKELISRIQKAVGNTGHLPTLHLEEPNLVRAVLWTSSIGGLSMNDFIVAAKIDQVKSSDLLPRKRAWA